MASIAVVLAPGPGSVFVAKAAGAKGKRAGQMAMLGIMLGDACLIMVSLLGVSALFRAHPLLFHVIRLAGAGYLIVLVCRHSVTNRRVKRKFLKGWFCLYGKRLQLHY